MHTTNQPARKIYKVSQINAAARMILEANFTSVWIEGEISNLAQPSSGHWYFSLKDETAQVRCAMFRQHNFHLKFKPKNGDHVLVHAQVSLYEARGDYQLIVGAIELAGAGLLHEKFLMLKAKLEAEGLFAPQYKKPLPKLPICIGIITSPTGAAVRDVLTILKRRFPTIPTIIYPTPVQGAEAANKISQALTLANQRQECDVLILTRGGGSLEDLWPFNEEIVARAIFASKIPVISAVGHEIDFTIADFVAAARAPTPSAAAELVVPDRHAWLADLLQRLQRLQNLMQHKMQQSFLTFESLQKRLRHPREYLQQQAQQLDFYEKQLQLSINNTLEKYRQRLSATIDALNLVSPLAVLTRGYAILSKDSHVVQSIKDVQINDLLNARFADGTVQCRVESQQSIRLKEE